MLRHVCAAGVLLAAVSAGWAQAPTDAEIASALGKHAGRAERLEDFMNGGAGDSDTTEVRLAQVVYARFYTCRRSNAAMAAGDVLRDTRIWQAYNDSFRAAATAEKPVPAPQKLEKRAMAEYGSDCESFVRNAPAVIVEDPGNGPFRENPEG